MTENTEKKYAIIKSGSQQLRVAEGDRVLIEQVAGLESDEVEFKQVLAYGSGAEVQIGKPMLEGAVVKGKVLGTQKQKKTVSFKHKKRKTYRNKTGHRQELMQVQIESIQA